MKKILAFIFIILIVCGIIAAYLIFGAATSFDEKTKSFVVEEGKTDKESVLKVLNDNQIIYSTMAFGVLADQFKLVLLLYSITHVVFSKASRILAMATNKRKNEH